MRGVSIIIITHNQKGILNRSLEHIFRHGNAFNEVVLVDNGSMDGTCHMVQTEFPQVKLIRLGKNTGVAGGRNVGASEANFDFLFFYDDDGRFDFSSLPLMVRLLEEKKDVAIATCQVINLPSEDIFSLDMKRYRPAVFETEYVHLFKGGASIIRRDVFLRVGMYPESFFYSCEEGDMSYRLFKRGYRIVRFKNAIMLHQKSAANWAERRLFFYRYRNRVYQIWRNLPFFEAIKGTVFLFGSGLIGGLFTMNLPFFLTGFASGLKGLPRVIMHERDPLLPDQFREYKKTYRRQLSMSTKANNLLKSIRFWRHNEY